MSNSEASDIAERDAKQIEILDDDVSLISASNPYGQLKSILIRVLLAVIFLGMGVGAVVYSVSNSKEETGGGDKNVTIPDRFDIRIDQSCHEGIFKLESIVNVTSEGEVIQKETTQIKASWIQYNTHQWLYMRLGLTPHNWIFTDYVHPSFTIRATRDNCVKNFGVSYKRYLHNMGLSDLWLSGRQDAIQINGALTPMVRYEGTAETSFAMNAPKPAVLFAYSNPNTGVTYGWEMMFPRSKNNTQSQVFHAQWWFGNMTKTVPDDSIFFDYPAECETNTINSTLMPFTIL